VRGLTIVPVRLREAHAFVASFHRHNKPSQGGLFAVGVSDGSNMVGVAVAGIPVSRDQMDGWTLEVTRCCALPAAPKGAPSALYGACWRVARGLGYTRLITTTLESEGGASLRGAGARVIAQRGPRHPSSSNWSNRPGREWSALRGQSKFVWEWSEGGSNGLLRELNQPGRA